MDKIIYMVFESLLRVCAVVICVTRVTCATLVMCTCAIRYVVRALELNLETQLGLIPGQYFLGCSRLSFSIFLFRAFLLDLEAMRLTFT